MKFYAVYKATAEKHVELEASNWQEAARIANTMARPILSEKAYLEVVGLCMCEDPEDCASYDAAHELIGPCNKCGHQILERGCSKECKGLHELHEEKKGGWCSTKHGHVTWCSQDCRDADRASDCDIEVLDRLSGV